MMRLCNRSLEDKKKGVNKVWRYIPPLEAPGSVQMEIDRWLFEQHCQGLHPPVLRFYTWKPAAISLGYHQRQYPEHWQNLIWQGEPVELVRRPTGGRAVLHQGDLTYAVILSGLPSSRMQSYQKICEFLIQGWRSLGVELHYGHAGRGYIHNPNCFGTATSADLITSSGRKLIGSAQLRQGDAVLQHGSMQLNPDPNLFNQVFGSTPPASPIRLNDDKELLSLPSAAPAMIIKALIETATHCFGVELRNQPLSDSELQMIPNQEHIVS
jgi:lipoate---protein ligase